LFIGATLLYMGGAFLNDAFDADYDRQHRRSRPIPSEVMPAREVGRWGAGLILLGVFWLFWLGTATGLLGVAVALVALAFNITHRMFALSPALLGLCRMFLYAAAASTGAQGVQGWALWCGLALAAYVAGVRILADLETLPTLDRYWPVALLAAPIALAIIMDVNRFRAPGLELSAVVGLWVLYCLRRTLWPADQDIAKATAGLTAGIVFVDWLAVVDVPREMSCVFLALFGAAMLSQRLTSAT
jgi:4-hydroxybenzoate polyprenyltransferase